MTGHKRAPILDTAKGFARLLRGDSALVDIMAVGAGNLGYYLTAPTDVRRMLDAGDEMEEAEEA